MMTATESAPTLLTYFTFILMLSGFVVYAFGRKIPGKGAWLVWAALLILLTGVGLDTGILVNEVFKVKIWMSGWIWPRDDLGAITIGILHDSLSFVMTALSALVAGAILLNHGFLSREQRPEKIYAAIAIATSGVTLAWNSFTPWLAFAGISLTLLGGFMAITSRWESSVEADFASRFAWERVSGFLLAFFGACILATTRPALLINPSTVWLTASDQAQSSWVGATLLVVGLFVQMQPFPLLGWIVSKSEVYPPVRTLLTQIFPAWASFALLLRFEPQFISQGVFPAFGWIALISSTVTILSGFFQDSWRQALGAWLAAGLSLSCAFLAFSGPFTAISLLLGVSLGSLILSSSGSALEEKATANITHEKKATWFKAATFLGAAAGTGFFGFVSATGGLRWVAQMVTEPWEVAIFLFIFFLFVLLGWRMAWKVTQIQRFTDASWLSVFSVFFLVLLTLGFVWTGTATGEILPGNPDRLFGSIFGDFFGNRAEFPHADDYLTVSGLYWGAIVLAFLTAYWTSGRKEDQWEKLASVFPRTSQFLKLGYGVDLTASRIIFGVVLVGQTAEKWIDLKIWKEWIPFGLTIGIKSISKVLARFDTNLSVTLGSTLRKLVDVPAKLLQLIQTGDIRWYLLFALGSGLALLSHFL